MAELIAGRYRIIEKIGEGGMGEVYAARDERLRRDVALKRLHAYGATETQLKTFQSRFEREAISMAQFVHPYIVPVYDFGDDPEGVYLVMGFMSGGSLKDRIGKPLPVAESAALIVPIAEALAYVHSHGLVHRDVKPHNILFNERGTPMLSDFGIVKLVEGDSVNLTTTGAGIGTPAYMAPEQMTRNVDHRADQYALGIILYEMLTGKLPFEGETPMMTLFMHRTEPLPDPRLFAPLLPDAMCELLNRMLAKDPQDRFTDMKAFLEALQLAAAEDEKNPMEIDVPLSDESSSLREPGDDQTMVGAPMVFDNAGSAQMPDMASPEQTLPGLPQQKRRKKIKKDRRKLPIWVPIAAGIVVTLCLIVVVLGMISSSVEERQATRTAQALAIIEATKQAESIGVIPAEEEKPELLVENPEIEPVSLSFSGSTAMQKLTEKFAGPFKEAHPGFEFNIQGSSSSVGILAVGRDTIDFGMTRRVLEEADWERFPRLNPHAIALDALLIIVNPASGIERCSTDELRMILTGEVNNWAAFGGPDQPIEFYLPPLDPDVTLMIDIYLAGEAGLKGQTTALDSNQAVVDQVAKNPNAVGLVFYGAPLHDVIVLAVNEVFPDEGKILNRAYPLVIEMVYITNNDPSAPELKFLDFVRSEQGARILRESGYIPIQ